MPDISNKEQVVKVVIFGEEYSIRGNDDPEYINGVAKYLDGKMKEIASAGKNIPPGRIAVLAALNLAGELFDLKRQNAEDVSEFEARTKNLLNMLDNRLTSKRSG